MNKSQLIDALAERYYGNRKEAEHALEAVLDTITREVVSGGKVGITGFGSFEKRVREARWVRNPQTGERLKAKKKTVPKFKAGQHFKDVTSGARRPAAIPKSSKTAIRSTQASSKRSASMATGTTKTTLRKSTGGARKTASK